MKLLLGVSHWINLLIVHVGRAVSWLIVPLMLIILVDVIARKVPGIWYAIDGTFLADYVSSVKLQEMEWHIHTLLFIVGLGYAYIYNMHVRVDLIRRKLPEKWHAYIEIFACAFLLIPYTSLLLYYGWNFVHASYVQNEGSQALTGLPYRWIIKSTLLIGIALMLLSGLRTLIRAVAFLREPPGTSFDAFTFDGGPAVAISVETPGRAQTPLSKL